MTTFRPADRVTALAPNFFGTLDRAVAEARAAGVDVIDVSKGNPDQPTPEHIVATMQQAVADPRHHRYPAYGYGMSPALRAAIATRYREDHGVDIDPETQLASFHGSHEGLMAAVLAFCNPGDTLIAPDPGYPAYASAALLAGAQLRHVTLRREHGYQPDFTSIADLPEASALLLNTPHNPTGALGTAESFHNAVAEADRLGAIFVHDFAYSSLGFARRPLSALTVDQSRTVEVSTMSKTYSMAGWRFGYAVGAPEIIHAMRRYQSHAFSTIFGATQDAAAAALGGDQSAAGELVALYRHRRDLVVAGLRAQGWDVTEPEGSFFVWVRVGDVDDVAFATRLLTEHGVAVAPGSGFGGGGRGFIRISLVHHEDRLHALIERLAQAKENLL